MIIHGRIREAIHLEDKPLIRIFTEHQGNIVPINFSISQGFFLQVYVDIGSGHYPLFLEQVIMHGCVPVIISNRLQPPFHQAQWWGKIFRVHPSQGCVKRENCWKLKKSPWLIINCLVVWNHGILWLSIFIGNVIIPTDELICFRGVGQPPTNQSLGCQMFRHVQSISVFQIQHSKWFVFFPKPKVQWCDPITISTPEYNLGQISTPGIWPEIADAADACHMFAECSGASFDNKTARYFYWSLVKNSCFPGDANISWLVGRSNRTQPVSHWESKYAGWGTYEPWMQSIYVQKHGWYHHSIMGSFISPSFVDWLLE